MKSNSKQTSCKGQYIDPSIIVLEQIY